MTTRMLVIWPPYHSTHGTRMHVRMGSLECRLRYELPVVWDTERDRLKYQAVLIVIIVK